MDKLSASAQQWRAELARRIAAHLGTAEKRVTDIPNVVLAQRTAPTAPCSVTYEPSLAIVAQGEKRVELGGNSFTYDPSRFLLTSVDLPVVSRVSKATVASPCLVMLLRINMPVVRDLLSRKEDRFNGAPSATPGMATGQTTAEILSACCRLVGLLDTPSDIPFLSDPIQQEILYRVLQSSAGPRLAAIATLGENSQRTAKAVAYIRENYLKPLRVDDLAKVAGMGVSTLHHHFRMLTAMTPLQFQKQLRLQAARARMLTEDVDAARAAFDVGYESASQFNREYSRFFGRPPLRDIKALRSPDAPPLESVANR